MKKKTLFSRRALSLLVLGCVAIIAYMGMPEDHVEVAKPLPPLPRLPQLNIQQWNSQNGMPIWFLSAQGQPLQISIRTNAGSMYDGQYPGLAWLTLAVIQKKINQDIQSPDLFSGRFFTDIHYRLSGEPKRLLRQLKHLMRTLKDPLTTKECVAGQALLQHWKTQAPDEDRQLAQQRFVHYAGHHDPMSHPMSWTCEQVNTFKHTFYNQSNSQILLAGQLKQKEAYLVSNKISRSLPSGNKVPKQISALPTLNQQLTHENTTEHRLTWFTPQPNDKDVLLWQLFMLLLPHVENRSVWKITRWGALQLELNQRELKLVIPVLAGTLAALNKVTVAQLHRSKRLLLQRVGRKISTFEGKVAYIQNIIYRQPAFTPNSALINVEKLNIVDLQPAITRLQRSPMILQSPKTKAAIHE